MANKFSDILQQIQNTQIRYAIEKMGNLCGITSGTKTGDAIVNTGGFTGNVTGNVTGDVAGNVVGNVTGNVTGIVTKLLVTKSADEDMGDADFAGDLVDLNGSSATVALTKFTPTQGRIYVISCSDASNAVTLTASSGVTLDGTNDVATFDAADECLILVCINATTCLIVENIGGVVLS